MACIQIQFSISAASAFGASLLTSCPASGMICRWDCGRSACSCFAALRFARSFFSTDDGHRTVDFGKLRAEIKHAHGMGQFDRVMFGKSHVGKCVLWHTAEDQILKIDQSGWHLVLRAN